MRSEAAVNAARKAGAEIQSDKKVQQSNTRSTMDASKVAKIDRETEDFHIEKVDVSISHAISKARQVLKLSQKDFATKINEKPSVVNDYESGKN